MTLLLQFGKKPLHRSLIATFIPVRGAKGAKSGKGQKGFLQNFRNQFISEEDAKKRPSDLEIAAKGLPKNTPTLGERVRRDRSHMFHEYDRKSGYYDGPTGTFRDHIGDPSVKETVVQGAGILKEEIKKWKTELSHNELEEWPKPGDRKYLIHSDRPAESRDIVTISDSDWGEGFSSCSMSKNPSTGKYCFIGELSTRVPRDGRTAYSGYVNFSSRKTLKSFFRVKPLEWHLYTHLVLRIRGDGRVYMINVNTWEEYDIAWQDLYTYPLYTRGGPYWQEVKIPFSKFIFTHRGALQDKQLPLIRNIRKAYKLGVTLKDQTSGPFSLEVDYIGVELDNDDKQEVCAYETYRLVTKNYTIA